METHRVRDENPSVTIPHSSKGNDRTHTDGDRRVILISKIRGLDPPSPGQMFTIRQQTGCGHTHMLIDRLYPAVRAFDQEFGVQESFDAEDYPVRAAERHRDAKKLLVSD